MPVDRIGKEKHWRAWEWTWATCSYKELDIKWGFLQHRNNKNPWKQKRRHVGARFESRISINLKSSQRLRKLRKWKGSEISSSGGNQRNGK